MDETLFAASPGKRLWLRVGYLVRSPKFHAFVSARRTRYITSWAVAVLTAAIISYSCWHVFDQPARADGNAGHTYIDFGGQYIMGRMLVAGHARQLYNRVVQRRVLREVYPTAAEIPPEKRSTKNSIRHDADALMDTFMGTDAPNGRAQIASILIPLGAVHPFEELISTGSAATVWEGPDLARTVVARGGPLYPPVNAFLCYPLALFDPQPAYRLAQTAGLALGLLAALALRVLARGRVWWPVAIVAVLLAPGFIGSLNLAQNAALTLVILVWGWVFIERGWETAGGAVWGLFAFKPVWALAFFLVPVLSARWRVCVSMAVTGALLALLTVPIVGWNAWVDWFHVGQEATGTYLSDPNWIRLSRDVLTIPRKWLDLDAADDYRRHHILAAAVGWATILAIFEVTVRLALWRQREVRKPTGRGAAFLLFAAWLTCFHFMYYDVLLALLPAFLLFTRPREYMRPLFVTLAFLKRRAGPPEYYAPRVIDRYPHVEAVARGGLRGIWVLNPFVPSLVAVLLVLYALVDLYGPPFETYGMMLLWIYCAAVIGLRRERTARLPNRHVHAPAAESGAVTQQCAERATPVASAHEGFAHQDRADPSLL